MIDVNRPRLTGKEKKNEYAKEKRLRTLLYPSSTKNYSSNNE